MNYEQIHNVLNTTLGTDIPFTISHNGNSDIVKVIIPDVKGETAFVSRILESMHMVPVPLLLSTEIASHGGLEYTNDPAIVESQFDDVNENASEDNDEEDHEAADVHYITKDDLRSILTETSARPQLSLGRNRAELSSIDIVPDDIKLKIISNTEMKKFADKVFNMISPGDDMSNYAAFLLNFDDFLLMHRSDTDYVNTDEDGEEGEEPSDNLKPRDSINELASKSPEDVAGFLKLFNDMETASSFLSEFQKFLPAELAKGKNPRSQLLRVLMKAMSSEVGMSAVAAWEAKDQSKLRTCMEQVAETVVGSIKSEE